MKRILALFGFLIAFIVMANVEHKSHQEEIRKAVLNMNQDVYEYILLQIDKPHVTDEDVVFFGTYVTNDNVWGTIGNHTFCRQW